jgi:hypothetical protein
MGQTRVGVFGLHACAPVSIGVVAHLNLGLGIHCYWCFILVCLEVLCFILISFAMIKLLRIYFWHISALSWARRKQIFNWFFFSIFFIRIIGFFLSGLRKQILNLYILDFILMSKRLLQLIIGHVTIRAYLTIKPRFTQIMIFGCVRWEAVLGGFVVLFSSNHLRNASRSAWCGGS